MRSRRAIVTAFALALLILGFWFWKTQLVRPAASSDASFSAAPANARSSNAGSKLPSQGAAANSIERSTLADALNSPATDIRSDLRLVSDLLETFRSNFA